jgi:hypothetical protein
MLKARKSQWQFLKSAATGFCIYLVNNFDAATSIE